jgi:hypothetical protein
MSAVRTFNVEAGLPTLDKARRLVIEEIRRAKREGVKVLKVIHGYGSSGQGGALCFGLRKSFRLRKKEGVIKDFIGGEDFSIFSDTALALLEAVPEMRGSAAMVLSMNPTLLEGNAAKDILRRMVEDLGPPGRDDHFGAGRLRLPKDFFAVLGSADAFVGNWTFGQEQNGCYWTPYIGLTNALHNVPAGATLVLNANSWMPQLPYAAITINTPITLKALPDAPVVIGN